jgi:hypothetical protein
LKKQILFLLAFALGPAAVAKADRAIPAQGSGPLDLPAPWRQPLTLHGEETADQAASPATLAQAAAGGDDTEDDTEDTSDPAETSSNKDAAALARQAQNPIANLISLPFRNNTNFGAGPSGDSTPNVLNIQPVVPVPLSKELLLVTRTIVPVINQPGSATGLNSAFGLGDIKILFCSDLERQDHLGLGSNVRSTHGQQRCSRPRQVECGSGCGGGGDHRAPGLRRRGERPVVVRRRQ